MLLIALTIAIRDIPAISASASPVAEIMRDQLGPVMERLLLVAVTFAFFGAGLVAIMACSRIVFAMSRDSRFPAHQMMGRVNPHTKTPVPATILIFVLGVVLMVALPGNAMLEMITAWTILPAMIYGSTIVLYLAVRNRLERKKGAFDLGRFELPVAIGALVWSLRAVRPGDTGVGAGTCHDRGRPARCRWGVLRLDADLPPRGARDRAR